MKNEKLKHLPVVMISTTKLLNTISTLFSSGTHVYIHKPGNFAQLKEIINNALPIALEKVFATSKVKYILNA